MICTSVTNAHTTNDSNHLSKAYVYIYRERERARACNYTDGCVYEYYIYIYMCVLHLHIYICMQTFSTLHGHMMCACKSHEINANLD